MGGVAYRRRFSNDPPESSFPVHYCVYRINVRPFQRWALQKFPSPAAILSENHD